MDELKIPEDLKPLYGGSFGKQELIERIARLEQERTELKRLVDIQAMAIYERNGDVNRARDEFNDYKERLWCALGQPKNIEFIAAVKAIRQERDELKGAMRAQDERERVAAERLGMFHNCDWPDAVADEVTALREQVKRLSELEARIQTLVGTECQRCERGDELFIEPSTRFYTHTLGGNYCSAHTLHSLLNTKASIAARAKGDHAKEEPHGTNHE